MPTLLPNYYLITSDNSQLSFPSGHASTSLAGLGEWCPNLCICVAVVPLRSYVLFAWTSGLASVFCIGDSVKFLPTAPVLALCLLLLSTAPLLCAFFIGLTRISDMWHFGSDVLGTYNTAVYVLLCAQGGLTVFVLFVLFNSVGWVIGGSCLVFSHVAFSGCSRDLHVTLRPFLPQPFSDDVSTRKVLNENRFCLWQLLCLF